MTVDEAIRLLDPKTTEQAFKEIKYYNGFNGKAAALEAFEDACVLAADALRAQQQRENPQPLTLEELRQMIGEPIFIKRKYEAVGQWKILDSYGKCSITEETFNFSDSEFEVLKHYGKVWLAYRYPPKEATHAAENDS